MRRISSFARTIRDSFKRQRRAEETQRRAQRSADRREHQILASRRRQEERLTRWHRNFPRWIVLPWTALEQTTALILQWFTALCGIQEQNRRTSHRRSQSRRLAFLEPLEQRQMLATLTNPVATTLDIALAANEDLAIVSNGGTYSFTSDTAFSDGGVASTSDFSSFGTTSLTMNSSGLTRYDTIRITDAGANTTVAFNDSGSNVYSDHFSVTLNDAAAGQITFNGASPFAGTSAITANTTKNIVLNSGSSLTTVNGGITLTANLAGTTSGNFVGIDVNNATVQVAGAGLLSLNGTGGISSGLSNYGVHVRAGGQVIGGSGEVTITGTGGAGTGNDNAGVIVQDSGSLVTSAGGNVTVIGQGGGSGASQINVGVAVGDAGTIKAGASGTVAITGTGGTTDEYSTACRSAI